MFYRLLMNKETFHRLNRIALLSMLCLSIIIPFAGITIPEENTTNVHQAISDWEQLIVPGTVEVEETASVTWVQIVLLMYAAGIIFFAGRNLYSLTRMILLLKSGRKESLHGGVKLIIHQKDIPPFSWMKYIVISEKDMEENSREILLHELAHIKKKHSVDLLLTDICIFFQWFNPAAWLMKQELQNIHEYEADESVINEGVDAKQYQLLLIKKAVGKRLYSMANSFNHSKLKKRITMMSKQKSKSRACLKYLFILPVATLSIAAFARPEVSNRLEELSNAKGNDLAEIVKTIFEENASYIEAVSQNDCKIQVIQTEDSIQGKKVKTMVIVKGSKVNTPKGVNVTLNLDSLKPGEKPLIIIDGKEANENIIKALKTTSIESVNILKDASAIKKYGEKGKNGVIVIILKNGDDEKNDGEITLRSGKSNHVSLLHKKISLQADSITNSSNNIYRISTEEDNPHFQVTKHQLIDTQDSSLKTKGKIYQITLKEKNIR